MLSNWDSDRQEMEEKKGPAEKCSKTLPSSDSPTERRAGLHILPLKNSWVSLYLHVPLSFFLLCDYSSIYCWSAGHWSWSSYQSRGSRLVFEVFLLSISLELGRFLISGH